ncbi:SdpI family protein [Gordonia sp. Z-3]|uniref:SdpI family protein n=1 Tax=Gordonia sp. Z-3 TaxID=3115408 RepID=UPI002E2A0BA4|nr:SdpI family protein [Gordonia sp. Z-3]MED5801069.1 SdpI family protein [Gordonia sp. Z-3]
MVVAVNVLLVVAAVIVFALAAMWLVVGALAITGRLRRNRWVGVRADATMRSDEAFAVANRVAAPGELAAAGILVLAGILTLGVSGYWALVFAVIGVVAALFVVGIVSAYGVRAAAAVPEDNPADDCGPSSCGACSLRGVCSNESAQV